MYSLYFITLQRSGTRPVTKPLRSIRPEHRGTFHTQFCLGIRTYVHTYIRTYVHTYICTYVHTYVRRQTDRQTDWLTDWLTETDRQTYIHTYTHYCIYICIYIHIPDLDFFTASWLGFHKHRFQQIHSTGRSRDHFLGVDREVCGEDFPTKPILYFTETMWNHQNPRIYHWTYHIIMNKDILCYPDIFMISQMYVLICSFFLAGSASSTIWSSEVRPPGMRKSIGGTFRWSAKPSLQWLKMVMIVNDIISGDWYGELSISDILSY